MTICTNFCHKRTCFDVSKSVDDNEHELSDATKPLLPHVQDMVQVIIVERVPVSVPHELLIDGDLLRDEQRDRFVAAVDGNETHHEASEAVCHKAAGRELVKIDRHKLLIVCPFGVVLVGEDFCETKQNW